jgi:hypothetical protein
MKNRALTLTFVACLVGSLAFADNPSDAPLVTDEGNTVITQPQNCSGGKSQQQGNKNESASSKGIQKSGRRHAAQARPDGQQDNPDYPIAANK